MRPTNPLKNIFAFILLSLLVVNFLSGCSIGSKGSKQRYLISGKKYLEKGKYNEALIQFKNALQMDPGYADAHYHLALTYLKLNYLENAYKELERVKELDPENLDARLRLGSFYLALGTRDKTFFDQARQEAEFVLKKDSKNIDARILLGHSYAGLSDIERSISELKAAIDQDPKRIESYINLSAIQVASNVNEAERTLKEALQLDQKSIKANLALATLYLAVKKLPEAEQYFKLAFEHNPTDGQSYLALVSFYITTKRLADAESCLLAAAKATPKNPEPVRTLASFYLATGASEKGLNLFYDLVKQDAHDLTSRKKLASALLDLNRLDQAEKQINALMDQQKDHDGSILKGRLLLQRHSFSEAVTEFKSALALAPSFAPAHRYLGEAHLLLGNVDQAKAELLASLEFDRNLLASRLLLAKVYGLEKRHDLALEQADTVLKFVPNNVEALLVKADCFMHEGKLKEAEALYRNVIVLAPDNPVAHHHLGATRALQGKEQEALQELEWVIARDADATDVMADMVLLYVKQKQNGPALARLDRQIQLANKKAPLYEMKAKIYLLDQKFDEAKSSLRQAIEADKNLLSAYLLLAGIYSINNQTEKALHELEEALRLKPDFVQALILRGMMLEAKKNYDQAANNYRAALEINSDLPIAANNLAWIYSEKGENLEVALNLAQKAKERLPENARVADTLGWIFYKKDILLLAIDQFKFSVAREPKNPVFHYHLGMALYKKGDRDLAKRELEAALRLGLSSAEASDARLALEALSRGN